MRTARARVIAGLSSSAARMAVMLAGQVAAVPIFLSHWSTDQYGTWLLYLTLAPLLQIADQAHQTFIGYECMKDKLDRISVARRRIYNGLGTSFLVDVFIALVLAAACIINWKLQVLSEGSEDLLSILLAHWIGWSIVGSPGGLMARALGAYGYFPRFNWWAFLMQLVAVLVPVICVSAGMGVLSTGITLIGSVLALNVLIGFDCIRVLLVEGLKPIAPNIRVGFQTYLKSLMLSGVVILENLRNQGVRLLLAPLTSLTDLVSFSTLRTVTNISLQGFSAVTQPIMPEMMRMIREESSTGINRVFWLIWGLASFIVLPVLLLLQAFGGDYFSLWTRGKVEFDSMLFFAFSASFGLYSIYQPSLAIVQGNNLVGSQVKASILTLGALVVLVTAGALLDGVFGAALGLLGVEFVSLFIYIRTSQRWLKENRFIFPVKMFLVAAVALAAFCASSLSLAVFPQYAYLAMSSYLCVLLLLLVKWSNLRRAISLPHARKC